MTDEERKRRNDARRKIIQTANQFKLKKSRQRFYPHPAPRVLGVRNLHEAVCIVRRNRLLPAATLIIAGFQP